MLLLVGSTARAAPATSNNLCTAQEQPVFACSLAKSGKLVSLCAPRGHETSGSGPLAYRFGCPGHVELAYVQPYARYRLAHYFRSQVDRYELSFDQGGFTYAVYDYRDESERPPRMQGIRVSRQNTDTAPAADLSCQGQAVARLQTLEEKVPCDRDNALSLGGCQN